ALVPPALFRIYPPLPHRKKGPAHSLGVALGWAVQTRREAGAPLSHNPPPQGCNPKPLMPTRIMCTPLQRPWQGLDDGIAVPRAFRITVWTAWIMAQMPRMGTP